MIVTCLSKRATVYQDYKPHIDFNIDFEQFTGGPRRNEVFVSLS